MFSWITGPRITNVIEDLQPDPAYDTTFIEPPETPAHQFAVNAFKHALFGTPAAEETNNRGKKLGTKAKLDELNSQGMEIHPPNDQGPPLSPSKQPNGILMTPGTANKGRKTVSFGAHVVDNEGKKANLGKSGIPNDCPGKFPSPWTPGTELKPNVESDKKPRTKLTEALYGARSTPQPKSGQKLKTEDDSDITLDLGAPRSESGKYWKEQFESYAEKSEKEMKQLVTKQQIAKNFAKKKDGETTELATKLAEERKRFRIRERELEQQNKDYQERLRQSMADNVSTSVEITALKNRIAILERSIIEPSSDDHNSRMFEIFEDPKKATSFVQPESAKSSKARPRDRVDMPSIILGNPVESTGMSVENKENSPPKSRHARRQSLPATSTRTGISRSMVSKIDLEDVEDSILPSRLTVLSKKAAPSARSTEPQSTSLLSARKLPRNKENLPPKSPTAALASSPLPQPSPDPWMDFNDSVPQVDRMALPLATAPEYSRPAKLQQSNRSTSHKASKSVSRASKPAVPETSKQTTKDPAPGIAKLAISDRTTPASEDMKAMFDKGKSSTPHTEDSSLTSKDKLSLSTDRKEQAKRRLLERKQKRGLA